MQCLIRVCGLLVLVVLTTSCAMKVAPTGGPTDRTPARVESTAPPTGSRNVTSDHVTFSFDDYVDRSVRTAFVVQPTTRFSTSYSGNEVDVNFEEPLQPNTTYTVTLGTEWRDARGNSPAEALTMVFSTGVALDSGRISGTVLASSMKSLMAFLYRTDLKQPDYLMPIGTSGAFQVGGLPDGTYRLIVVRDENKSGTIDQNEDYVCAPEDVTVAEGFAAPIDLLLGPSQAKGRGDTAHTDAVRPDNKQTDTTKVDSLAAPPERVETGTIMGSFTDSLGLKGPYLLRLRNTTGTVVRALTLVESGSFAMDSIPPGSYTLDIVIDVNGNGIYDHGVPEPYVPGERWVPMAGTITVRPRWTTEGISVVLRVR
jgi:uncharacterized protein (DUF2141 family)